ncbi:MAG TPA: response regulator [Candidatus Angelobacter sp.]|nr:response regulator [Candidatus Angelobacter sp.]
MKQILIVEDKPNSRELLRTVLEQQGYAVLEAGDGEQAIKIIREKPLDLVLMDLQIPARNGYDVLKEIRSDPKLGALPVVAVTANAMPEDQEKVMAAGFTGYISKPVALARLREEVNRLLNNK